MRDRYAVIVDDAMSLVALIATFTAYVERGSLLTEGAGLNLLMSGGVFATLLFTLWNR